MKLVDILGTKYITVAHSRDIKYFMSSLLSGRENVHKIFNEPFQKMKAEGPPFVLDLAGARIATDAMIVLSNFVEIDDIEIIDSVDRYRDEMFKESKRRWLLSDIPVPLPVPKDRNKVHEVLNGLQKSYVYKVDTLQGNKVSILVRWVLFIMFVRPEISIDLGILHSDFFKYAASVIDIDMMDNMPLEVVYDAGNTYVYAQVENEKIYDPETCALVPIHAFVNKYYTIPAVVGREHLLRYNTDDYYLRICNNVIHELMEQLHTPKTFFNLKF